MRTAIFGGAFDPPHIEHVSITAAVLAEGLCDEIVVIPTGHSPHKANVTDFEHRYDMAKLAFADVSGVTVSDIDSQYSTVNYTVDMLPEYRRCFGDVSIIIGGDSLMNILKWYKAETLLHEVRIIVVPRGESQRSRVMDYSQRLHDEYGADITITRYVGLEISSQLLRGLVETLRYIDAESAAFFPTVGELLPATVIDYVHKHSLYDEYDLYLSKLRDNISPTRFQHTLRTALYALQLNTVLSLPFRLVFLAGILHDCGKGLDKYLDEIPKTAIGTPIQHQYVGALIAERDYGVTDQRILTAIRYHSTSHINASDLDKLIYACDTTEPIRAFPNVRALREAFKNGLDALYRACVEDSYRHLMASGRPIFPLTKKVYNSIK